MRYLLAAIPIVTLCSLIFYFKRPRCWTCGKKKFQMNFTDKFDCLRCHMKNEAEK